MDVIDVFDGLFHSCLKRVVRFGFVERHALRIVSLVAVDVRVRSGLGNFVREGRQRRREDGSGDRHFYESVHEGVGLRKTIDYLIQ